MPIFDYKCNKCHKEEELLIFNSKEKVNCSTCKKPMIQLMGAPSTIFKGKGFYKEGFSK